MPNVAHFAINADDVARAKRFYERVFGWTMSSQQANRAINTIR